MKYNLTTTNCVLLNFPVHELYDKCLRINQVAETSAVEIDHDQQVYAPSKLWHNTFFDFQADISILVCWLVDMKDTKTINQLPLFVIIPQGETVDS